MNKNKTIPKYILNLQNENNNEENLIGISFWGKEDMLFTR